MSSQFDASNISWGVISSVLNRYRELGADLYFHSPTVIPHIDTGVPAEVAPYEQSPLQDIVKTLVQIANGEVEPDETTNDAIQSLMETLFIAPLSTWGYEIPPAFWTSDLGQVVLQVQLKLFGDRLITLSEAATILRGKSTGTTLKWVNDQIKKGTLKAYIDVGEPNPQKNTRVRLSEVESLRGEQIT